MWHLWLTHADTNKKEEEDEEGLAEKTEKGSFKGIEEEGVGAKRGFSRRRAAGMDPPQQAVIKALNCSTLMLRSKEDEEHHQEEAHGLLRHRSLRPALCSQHISSQHIPWR